MALGFLLRVLIGIFSNLLLTISGFAQADRPPDESLVKAANLLPYLEDRLPPEVTQEPDVKKTSGYFKIKGRVFMADPTRDTSFEYIYYKTRLGGPKAPLVFIHSGLFGITPLEKHYARYLAKRGVSAVISHYLEEEAIGYMENMPEVIGRTLKAGLLLTDFFAAQPEVDAQRLALLGVSYGGIRGIYHMGLDPRLKAAAIMVAGVPLPEVLAFSQLLKVKHLRDAQMRQAGITSIQEYQEAMQPLQAYDIRNFLAERSPEDFYLVMANNDKVVPTINQWHLWRALGGPRHRAYQLGHEGTAIWAGFHDLKRILQFFAEKWHPLDGTIGRF